jgi:uncharacterized membrane protein YccC
MGMWEESEVILPGWKWPLNRSNAMRHVNQILRTLLRVARDHERRLFAVEKDEVTMGKQIDDLAAAEAALEAAEADQEKRTQARIDALNIQIAALQNTGNTADPTISAVISGMQKVVASLQAENPDAAPPTTDGTNASA